MIALLAKPVLKYLVLALVIGGLIFGLKYYRNEAKSLAAINKQQEVTISSMQAQYKLYQEALNEQSQKSQVREHTRTVIKTVIQKTPDTHSCVSSPAVAAALDGLRTQPITNGKPSAP